MVPVFGSDSFSGEKFLCVSVQCQGESMVPVPVSVPENRF